MYKMQVKVSSLTTTRHLTFSVVQGFFFFYYLPFSSKHFCLKKNTQLTLEEKVCFNVKTIRENVGGWSCQSWYFWKCPWLWRWTRRRPEHLCWHVWNCLNLKAPETNTGAEQTASMVLLQPRRTKSICNRSDTNNRHNAHVWWLKQKEFLSI